MDLSRQLLVAGDETFPEDDDIMATTIPHMAHEALFVRSTDLPTHTPRVRGYDFSGGVDHHALLGSLLTTGFQATAFGQAVLEVNRMIAKRKEPIPVDQDSDGDGLVVKASESSDEKPLKNCTIFLGYTSNMISCGVRESLKFLVQHSMVDVIVTTAGGVEEDLIKCMAHTFVGDFALKGKDLRLKGINRTGNLLVPNNNYCLFEDWVMPILDQMLLEQTTQNMKWTPSKMIARLGKEIDNPDSVCYWAYKNNIQIFSPAITDGSLGDMLYFHSYRNPGLILDVIEDIRLMNNHAVHAKNTGMIILGGGVIKHHICNANLMRNGANFSVNINTAQEFDGSDSGARPDEAVSWGKISITAKPVKVYADASLVFPLLVAETFAREHFSLESSKKPGE
ncbi:deoxyhypusine synthase isoform X1 [Lethenteron reissneri]|uniref:deoxyhypusine synthase isoform X1 n=2 Tax=Lethenteron reissneri TaxID=7753 RepID=UPI002AB78878|nr:deoxyhypusine synthase isoform X1 [Lethenteron reissneri]